MNNIDSHILHQIAARYISGKPVDIEIKGSEIQLEALQNLLNVSKELKESLDKESDFSKVKKILENKKNLTIKFQNLTGIEWKL